LAFFVASSILILVIWTLGLWEILLQGGLIDLLGSNGLAVLLVLFYSLHKFGSAGFVLLEGGLAIVSVS
jgi:hypothetical protein